MTPSTRTVEPGQRIQVIFTDWQALSATLSICGNQAGNGSSDCNMVESTGVRLRHGGDESLVHDMVVVTPPADCPCVIRAVGNDTAEVALATIDLVGHPVGAVTATDPDRAIVGVAFAAERDGSGPFGGLRSMLGGATEYTVTVEVQNLVAEPLSNLSVHGRAFRGDDTAAEFDLEPGPVGPGQTWTGQVDVALPAPVAGTYQWEVVASGAGPVAVATSSTRSVPWLLIGLVAVLAGVLVMMLVRLGERVAARRRSARGAERSPVSGPAVADGS